MNPIALVAAIFVIFFAFTIVMWYISTWNRLVRLEKDVDRAWSNIDTLLQQRYSMIPNLVKIVGRYVKHEESIFGELTKARKMFAAASASKDVKGVNAAESLMNAAIPKITALSEDYPELKANKNFEKLQEDLVDIENQVTDQRQLYNSSATNFNIAIETIPTNIVANAKGCVERDLFIAGREARSDVVVDFDF